MPRPAIRPLPALATTIRNLPVRRPLVPILFKPATLLGRGIPRERDGALDEHAFPSGVAHVVEFAFKVARGASAVADDRTWVGERFADVAVVVADAPVVERLGAVSGAFPWGTRDSPCGQTGTRHHGSRSDSIAPCHHAADPRRSTHLRRVSPIPCKALRTHISFA